MSSRRHYDYNRKLVLKGLKCKDLFLNLVSFFFDFLKSDGIYFKIFIPFNIINLFQQIFALWLILLTKDC